MTFTVIEGGKSSVKLAELIRSYRFNFSNEKDLQDGIAAMLNENGISYEREVELQKKAPATRDGIAVALAKITSLGRIDFKIGKVGIEIKVGGGFQDAVFQLHRYSTCDEIAELVLVTTRTYHDLPNEIGGKRLTVVNLGYSSLL